MWKTAGLTLEEAYESGWDYPPFMSTYGVISVRTCPDCHVMETAWAALMLRKVPCEELTDSQKEVVRRINGKPENMKTHENRRKCIIIKKETICEIKSKTIPNFLTN